MSVYIVSFLQILKICLVMISPKHSISATIEGNVIDSRYVGELEIHVVLPYHCATYGRHFQIPSQALKAESNSGKERNATAEYVDHSWLRLGS